MTPGTSVRVTFGDEHFISTRSEERWVVVSDTTPHTDDGPGDHIARLVLPGDDPWRAWIEPNGASGILDATAGSITTWQEGVAVTTGLPPADWPDFEALVELPPEWRPPGLDLAVRFTMSGVPGGSITATWIWRNGTLVGQAGTVPGDLPPESVIEVRGPARAALEYICGDRSIYEVMSKGSTVSGHPAMLQFFVGYLEQEGFTDKLSAHQRLVRAAFADYLEHPPLGVIGGELA